MVQCSVAEIKRFILEMKNPDKLLGGCEVFRKEEPRDLAYIVARKIILERPDSVYHIVAGIKISAHKCSLISFGLVFVFGAFFWVFSM
jgi:hypothetical protein